MPRTTTSARTPITGERIKSGARTALTYTGAVTASGNEITDAVRTTNTQGDGVTPPDSSYGIWPAATNLVTNGGFESNATGWSQYWGAGGTIVRSTAHSKFGTASGLYTASGATGVHGPYWFTLTISGNTTGLPYTASGWIFAEGTAIGQTARMTWNEFGGATGTEFHTSSNTTLVAGWNYISVSATVNRSDRTGIQVIPNLSNAAAGDYIYIDGVQLETGSIATPYIETNGGTASRSAARVQAPPTLINATQSWFVARLKMGFASTQTIHAANRAFVAELWQDGNNHVTLERLDGSNSWHMRRRNTGGSSEAAQTLTFAEGDFITVIGSWDSSQTKISLNGAAFSAVAGAFIPTSIAGLDIGTGLGIGSNVNAIDSNILWFAAGTGILTNADATTLNGYGNTDPTIGQLNSLGSAQPTMVWPADTITYNLPGRLQVV